MRLSMRVWDSSLRAFHAGLVLLLVALVATGLTGAARWHAALGTALAVLLVWRLIWGFAGSETARFAAFLVAPGRARPTGAGFGHAEAGGFLLPLLLALIAAADLSGHSPPLHRLLVALLLALVAVHVGLMLAAAFRGEAPFRASLTGKIRRDAALRAPRLVGPLLGLVSLAVAVILVFGVRWLLVR